MAIHLQNVYLPSFILQYTIIVQDPIQNLTVEKYHIPSIWGNLSTVLWNITQGTY